jgi:hypothetical protein
MTWEKVGAIHELPLLKALRAQTQTKKNFESVALQRFQNFSCGSFDRQLL